MPRPRCLLVAQTFPPLLGGSAEVHAALARHAGGAVAVLTARRDHRTGQEHPGWQAEDAAQPFPVHRLAMIRPPLGAAAPAGRLRRRLHRLALALRLAAALAWLVLRHQPRAVCVCDDDALPWLPGFARRVLRRRVLVLCHGDDLAGAPTPARRRALGAAHRVVAASAHAARRLAGRFGVDPARVATIPNGVDLARFRPLPPDPALRAALGLEGRRVLLAPARLVPRKGVDRLLAALPAVLARHPDAALLVAGDGPQRPALEAMAAGLPVRFAGAVAAAGMPALYALAEVVALPNRADPGEEDGLPLVILEAQACGRPVLGGRAGGTPEAIADGATGLLVEGDDAPAIAAALCRLLDDPALAARLGAAGLESARRQGWQARAAAFLALC
ncbi:glycosyltransferase family 4 protein [Roseococcus sp. DSY-14]|uniref:glycosyltransferase family 4 protein n=1 Tax=Roseococcus sp. DSY-14 TaxID=3369650 RepID=UPI00387B2C4A